MTPVEASAGFAALGSEPRLDVMRTLVRAGGAGLATGEIQKRLRMPASTLAHHLRFLAMAGLVTQLREGRSVICTARFDHVAALAEYLMDECCADAGRRKSSDAGAASPAEACS